MRAFGLSVGMTRYDNVNLHIPDGAFDKGSQVPDGACAKVLPLTHSRPRLVNEDPRSIREH